MYIICTPHIAFVSFLSKKKSILKVYYHYIDEGNLYKRIYYYIYMYIDGNAYSTTWIPNVFAVLITLLQISFSGMSAWVSSVFLILATS